MTMPPKHLYKYRCISPHTESIVRDPTLWFSTPDQLNDPFDCDPVFDTTASQVEFRDHIMRTLKDAHPSVPDSMIEQRTEEIVGKEWPISTGGRNRFEQDYRQRLQRLGVFSASERWDSIVMWSHYADKHRGLCLEIDVTLLPPSIAFRKVEYVDRRPVINLFTALGASANKIAAGTKNQDWAYEKEWRLVLEANPNGPSLPCAIDMPDRFITSVILGARIRPEDKDKVLHWMRPLDRMPSIYEAYPDKHHFRMNKKDVTPK